MVRVLPATGRCQPWNVTAGSTPFLVHIHSAPSSCPQVYAYGGQTGSSSSKIRDSYYLEEIGTVGWPLRSVSTIRLSSL